METRDDGDGEEEIEGNVSRDQEQDSNEPEVIRGNSKKRKRPQPSIPFAGGQETSYGQTHTEKLEKNKQPNVKEDFDYDRAINQQNQNQRQQHQRRGRGNQRGRGGRGNTQKVFERGRGSRNFARNPEAKRKQFDDMEDLQEAEASGAYSQRGADKKRRFHGNKSFTVRGSGRGNGNFRGR